MKDNAPRRLLFVDDNIDLLDGILRALEYDCPNWTFDVAGDIDSAWEYMCTTVYDCLVFDVMLPTNRPGLPEKGEGLYLVNWVRSEEECIPKPPRGTLQPGNRRAPILLFTSRTSEAIRGEAARLNIAQCDAIGRLEKDVTAVVNELIALVQGPNHVR